MAHEPAHAPTPAENDSARLLEAVYDELRQLAAARLAREKPGQTIQATALVHEAYLRLVDGSGGRARWDNRGHFFAAAAEAMRRILVEQARRKHAQKRGGGDDARHRVDLRESQIVAPDESIDIVALSQALDRLQGEEPDKAALVKLRYFA